MKRSPLLCVFLAVTMLFLAACAGDAPVSESEPLPPYASIQYFEGYTRESYEENEYSQEDIVTYTFNQGTILKGSEELQAQIMENGKNPGMGIRGLHAQGITGKGVNVAIIDQNLLLDHPEFSGKIAAYYDTGCEVEEDTGSMHGPGVTSLLVGNTIGVAPDAKVYYAAAPTWTLDSEYYAKGLYWIIEENKKLPADEKIRVVSVSAAPSGESAYDISFTQNTDMWKEALRAAHDEGILVIDCGTDKKTGFVAAAFYDPADPDSISLCTGGFPKTPRKVSAEQIGAPASYRTVAEQYTPGAHSYLYTGQGGVSWSIPYAAGVLALGWQVNPDLDMDRIVEILFDTCSLSQDGSTILNPPAFIDAVRDTLQ